MNKMTSSLEEMYKKGPQTPLGVMAAALEWYADPANWTLTTNGMGQQVCEAELDRGIRAGKTIEYARHLASIESTRLDTRDQHMAALDKMQCPRCLIDFKEHTPHGFIERFGGELHDSERCAENLRIQMKHFEAIHRRFLKEAGELLGVRNAQPWTYMDILSSIKAFKERVDHLHQSQPREKEFNAGVEAACLSLENHSCVSTCCDAQPGAAEAKELARCVRKNHQI